jgi:hypothetical protein
MTTDAKHAKSPARRTLEARPPRATAVVGAIVLCAGVAAAAAPGCGSNPSGATTGDAGSDALANSSSSSSGGAFTGGGDDSGDGGGGCSTVSKKAEKIPLDMVIGLDTSFSMDFDDKWTNVKAALESFVTNPAESDLNLGLQFFPIRKQCSVPDYEALAVNLAPAAASGPMISTALEGQMMSGGTPTVPLLQGLVAYLDAHPNPAHRPVILLATDGIPDDTCNTDVDGETPNTLANAMGVAAAAFGASPSISTFVIGVGSDLSALNGIAQSGGTGTATLVDTGSNAQAQFLAALDAARRSAIPCDFTIPPGNFDPTQTNVQYAPGTGAPQEFIFVGDSTGCPKASSNGWYFDNPTAPTKVSLCPDACTTVKADDVGQVNVVFGCPRIEIK